MVECSEYNCFLCLQYISIPNVLQALLIIMGKLGHIGGFKPYEKKKPVFGRIQASECPFDNHKVNTYYICLRGERCVLWYVPIW